MDLDEFDQYLTDISLNLAKKKYPKFKILDSAVKKIQYQWGINSEIASFRLRPLWHRIKEGISISELNNDELADAAQLLISGIGHDCPPLFHDQAISDAIIRQIIQDRNTQAAERLAACTWYFWSENTEQQNKLCGFVREVSSLSQTVADAVQKGFFDPLFPQNIASDAPIDLEISEYLSKITEESYLPPSETIVNIAWKAGLNRYTKRLNQCIAESQQQRKHDSDVYKNVVEFIETESLISGKLRDPHALNAFAEAILSPFSGKIKSAGDFEELRTLLLDLFTKFLGPITEIAVNLEWQQLDQKWRQILEFWNVGRTLSDGFEIISNAEIMERRGARGVRWLERKQFWMEIWAQGLIMESHIFVPSHCLYELRRKFPLNKIGLLNNSNDRSSALIMKIGDMKNQKIQAIEISNLGSLRIIDYSEHPELDLSKQTELDYTKDITSMDSFYTYIETISHGLGWQRKATYALENFLGRRI